MGDHPDLHLYIPDEKSGMHPIAQMQKIIQEMALPPFEAPFKVFILDQAEKMLPTSSNALLKTLEEPAQDTYFFLLSNHPEQLLPTLRSRLYPITFDTEGQPTFAIEPYIELVQQGDWVALLEALPALEEQDPHPIFESLLCWAARDPQLFLRCSTWVSDAEKALAHNIKLTTVLQNLFLLIDKSLFKGRI